ncbi:hypothetical protein [Boudabousia liubingyangii]|uniref:hypothetical protein n=1 Tax=Boudabousia liubingyangii TaxID=1921764 RepID=UPI000F7B66F9|nr:hypothetical protein [Boudabousia liubingyangii]
MLLMIFLFLLPLGFIIWGVRKIVSASTHWDAIIDPISQDFFGLDFQAAPANPPASINQIAEYVKVLATVPGYEGLYVDLTPEAEAIRYQRPRIAITPDENYIIQKAEMEKDWHIPLYPQDPTTPKFGALAVDRYNCVESEGMSISSKSGFSTSAPSLPAVWVQSPFTGVECRFPVNPKMPLLALMRQLGWQPRNKLAKTMQY